MEQPRFFSRWISAALGLALVFALSVFPLPARADVAPPEQPPGANPGPDSETTQVRMMDEVVILDVLAEEPVRAHVTANFTMRNLGTQTESMSVRFPLGAADGFYNILEIQNFGVRVNDAPVAYRRVIQETEVYGQQTQMPWATFPVTFPPGKDVFIKISYDLTGTAWEYDNYAQFSYILETGAGWKDTIGSATIILRLPYEASELNILNLRRDSALSGIQGREAVWIFKNLEPTAEDNFAVEIVKPVIWGRIDAEKRLLATQPRDGEAWGRLAKAYKRSFTYPKPYCREDGTSEQLYALSKEAYENAVSLKPEDALWHAGFADLLAHSEQWGCPSIPGDRIRALQEIHAALQIAPNDPKVQEIASLISWLIPEGMIEIENGYAFPWLTQTPVPTETTVLATLEPAPPTQSGQLPQTPSSPAPASPPVAPSPAPNMPAPLLPFCGTALALPLFMAALALWRKT